MVYRQDRALRPPLSLRNLVSRTQVQNTGTAKCGHVHTSRWAGEPESTKNAQVPLHFPGGVRSTKVACDLCQRRSRAPGYVPDYILCRRATVTTIKHFGCLLVLSLVLCPLLSFCWSCHIHIPIHAPGQKGWAWAVVRNERCLAFSCYFFMPQPAGGWRATLSL